MSKLVDAARAADLVQSGDTILITGSGGGVMDADFVYEAIEKRFMGTSEPHSLTLIHITGIGNRNERGVSRFAHRGMTKRVIGGHWGWSPQMAELALHDEIEAYNLPQGCLSLLTREIAARRLGLLTKVGLNTFVDPRHAGGRINEVSANSLVELVTISGEEFLLYKAFPISVTILRGTVADEDGNVSVEGEAANLDVLSAAQAARSSGGRVIAQVRHMVSRGQIRARDVQVPGIFVDAVVVNPDQMQTKETLDDPCYSGKYRGPSESRIEPLEFGIRKWIARRAAQELEPDQIVNLGFGVADGVANVVCEEGLLDRVVFSVEQGAVGGVPAKGDIFGAAFNPDAFLDAPSQFDFYHGGGLDIAFLGMAQVDRHGNVNVSKFGGAIPGVGGFIDISQNAKRVVFCGSLTAGGLVAEVDAGALQIAKEGRAQKFVNDVEQISFSGAEAQRRGQSVTYVTERAVFRLAGHGIELIEVAPGLDVERDVIAHMGFRPLVSSSLAEMDPRIFRPEKMGPDCFGVTG